MIVMIDNYDSFTYNLVQYFGELEPDVRVFRNDEITVAGVRELDPSHIVVSPGPCTPNDAGISVELIRTCLGHQSIGQAYGGEVVRADRIMHGKVSPIRHNGSVLFAGIDNPFTATRYHSLIVRRESCPDALEITAETDAGEIMAVQHRVHPVWGVQFHPESILTEAGKRLIANFLAQGKGGRRRAQPRA